MGDSGGAVTVPGWSSTRLEKTPVVASLNVECGKEIPSGDANTA